LPNLAFMLLEPSITNSTVGVMRDAVTCADAHTFGSLTPEARPGLAGAVVATSSGALPEAAVLPN
jgi:hypothetical protein